MVAVTKTSRIRSATRVGYEVNDKGQAKVALATGDLVIISPDTPPRGYETVFDKAPITGITEAMGVVLMPAVAGGDVEVAIQGEMDGFTGLTPGTPLYPSTATPGGIDTTAIAGAPVRMRAVTPTLVRFSFV
jgi:hypothetical protein